MDENIARLLIALGGAAAGALFNRALAKPKERRELAASAINGVCSALRGMIDGFGRTWACILGAAERLQRGD